MTKEQFEYYLKKDYRRYTVVERANPIYGTVEIYVPGGKLTKQIEALRPVGVEFIAKKLPWWRNWLTRRKWVIAAPLPPQHHYCRCAVARAKTLLALAPLGLASPTPNLDTLFKGLDYLPKGRSPWICEVQPDHTYCCPTGFELVHRARIWECIARGEPNKRRPPVTLARFEGDDQ